MTLRRAPAWLEELESRFGVLLALPLDREQGSLTATPERYDPELERAVRARPHSPASARLAVYQRQYWFRLLTAMQTAFPLTTRLLGRWHFNELAAEYLRENPPSGSDLDAVSVGFERFLAGTVSEPVLVRARPSVELDARALVEAAELDAAHHRVSRAPAIAAYRPSAADAERLLAARLRRSPAVALLRDSFGLWPLRARILEQPGDVPVRVPPQLATPLYGAVVRSGATLARLPLEALEYTLLCRLGERPVAEALAELEAACSAEERASLPERAQRWLSRSVELGFFCALES